MDVAVLIQINSENIMKDFDDMVRKTQTKTTARKKCNKCNKAMGLNKNNFYKIQEPNDNFPDDYVNVCKTCLQEEWEDEKTGFMSFMDFLRVANIPYLENVYSLASGKGDYLRRIRQAHYSNLRFMDSDAFTQKDKKSTKIKKNDLKELSMEQVKECELFWGENYTEKEYLFLMNQYADYNVQYDISSKSMEDIVMQIVLTNLQIRRGREKDANVKSEIDILEKLMAAANLKPVQERASAENEANTFSTWIKKIENEEPIPLPLPEYADVDHIEKYVKGFFTGAQAKALGEENPYPEEYKEMVEKNSVEYDGG